MSGVQRDWVKLNVDAIGSEAERFLNYLRQNVRGQDDPIKHLADAIELDEASFHDDDKPVGTFLFLGPSGVGKTFLAELTAFDWFGLMRAFTYVPCQAYSEDHAVAKLIGSPPGYVGFDKPAILGQTNIDRWAVEAHKQRSSSPFASQIEKVRKTLAAVEAAKWRVELQMYTASDANISQQDVRDMEEVLRRLFFAKLNSMNKLDALNTRMEEEQPPIRLRSIILFDEVEKASSRLHNLLLDILDKAELPMSNNEITHFNNSLVIMTSNAGARDIADTAKNKVRCIGYRDPSPQDDSIVKDQEIYEAAMKAAEKIFPPEYIGRFTHISVFRTLSEPTLREIFDLELNKFVDKFLKPMCVSIHVDEEVKKFIVSEATDKPQYGARLLKVKIYKHLKKQLARLKNRGELRVGDIIHLTLSPGQDSSERTIEYYRETPKLIGPPE